MSRIITFLKNPVRAIKSKKADFRNQWLENAMKPGNYENLSDLDAIRARYYFIFGKFPHLKHPKTFNEKLQWLKLYNRKPEYTNLVDKYEVKKIVAGIIGEEYIIPTLGVWDNAEEIDFDSLPDQFVLKCTHDTASVTICKDKAALDREAVKKHLNDCLQKSLFLYGREWPYKHVKPRIIAEPYLEDHEIHELRDYKLFCFNGKVRFFKVDYNRFVHHNANYYDKEGNFLPFGEEACPSDRNAGISLPANFFALFPLAEKLADGIPFVRVDFYIVDGKIYFGELTFFPSSGFGKFEPKEWDEKLGSWIQLPKKKLKRD